MNKQIEEIKKLAETLRLIDELQFDPNYTLSYQRAMCLNKAGYRKSTDVAREIFADIKKCLMSLETPINKYWVVSVDNLTELKKKYESEEADDEG